MKNDEMSCPVYQFFNHPTVASLLSKGTEMPSAGKAAGVVSKAVLCKLLSSGKFSMIVNTVMELAMTNFELLPIAAAVLDLLKQAPCYVSYLEKQGEDGDQETIKETIGSA